MGGTVSPRQFLRNLGRAYAKKWSGPAMIDFGPLGSIGNEPTGADAIKVASDQVLVPTLDPRKRRSPETSGQALTVPGVLKVDMGGSQVFAGPKMLQGATSPQGFRQVREIAKTKLPAIADGLLKLIPFVGPHLGSLAKTTTDSALSLHSARLRKSEQQIKELLSDANPDAGKLHVAARYETAALAGLAAEIDAKRKQVSDAKKTCKQYLGHLEPLGHGPCYYFSHLYGYAYYYFERRQQLGKLIEKLDEYSMVMTKWLEVEDTETTNLLLSVDKLVGEYVIKHDNNKDCGPNCYQQKDDRNKRYPRGWVPPPPVPAHLQRAAAPQQAQRPASKPLPKPPAPR